MKSFGTWEVTTEGDVEGKTSNILGKYTGFIDEIALYLSNHTAYSLRFKLLKPVVSLLPKSDTTIISFIEDYTLDQVKEIFSDRKDIEVTDANYWRSFTITNKTVDSKRMIALSKLSEEDKEILGLK